eukprot:484596-Rhodomonas_salina.2
MAWSMLSMLRGLANGEQTAGPQVPDRVDRMTNRQWGGDGVYLELCDARAQLLDHLQPHAHVSAGMSLGQRSGPMAT